MPSDMPAPTYVWNSPDSGVSIHLPLEVVQSLGLQAMEALKSIPRRGLEIGGLLFGRREASTGPATFDIEAFETVKSEYRRGPSYLLSDGDVAAFDKSMERRPGAVGIFRTHTRSESLSLEPDDVALFNRLFSRGDGVFLLVHPASRRGAFFLPVDGALSLAHEFPFSASDLPAATDGERKPVATLAPAGAAEVLPNPDDGRLPPPSPQAAKWRKWVIPVFAALALTVGTAAFMLRSRTEKVAAPVPERLALQVARDSRALRLSWDGGAPPLQDASHGLLHISDGSIRSQMHLTVDRLRAGRVVYWPDSDNVTFQLDVFHGEQRTSSDTLRVVGTAPLAQAQHPPAKPVTAAAPAESRRERVAVRPPRRPTGPVSEAGNVQPVEPAPIAATSSASRSKPEDDAKPSPFEMPAPEAKKPAPPEPPSRPVDQPPRPATAGVIITVTAEPAGGSGVGRLIGHIPFVRRLKNPKEPVVPPRVRREVRPSLTARDQREITSEIPVNVKVYVNESGRVEFAELLGDSEHRNLAAAAVYAARRWEFSPAQKGEEKAPSEVILRFRFAPAEMPEKASR